MTVHKNKGTNLPDQTVGSALLLFLGFQKEETRDPTSDEEHSHVLAESLPFYAREKAHEKANSQLT